MMSLPSGPSIASSFAVSHDRAASTMALAACSGVANVCSGAGAALAERAALFPAASAATAIQEASSPIAKNKSERVAACEPKPARTRTGFLSLILIGAALRHPHVHH